MSGTGGVGLAFRAELAADLLRRPSSVDFVEVVAESCFVQPATRREARALTELWPVVPHGVKLSLGAAEGIEPERARALGALARELGAPVISEHIAFVRSGGREIGHLTALPYTRTAVSVVAGNVARARRYLPDVPFLLENVAWSFAWPDHEMSEGDFYSEVAAATGCPLLLDVGNLYANAVNSGEEPWQAAERFPLEQVGMIHLAGGVSEHGFYFDDHAHAVPEPVFLLLERVLNRTGAVPMLLERDALFPEFTELTGETERCRNIQRGAAPKAQHKVEPTPLVLPSEPMRAELVAAQNRITCALTDVRAPNAADEAHFGAEPLRRSREILKRKRVDEALPILGFLARHKPELEVIGRAVVDATPRQPRLAAIADAWAIAERAVQIRSLADDARRDCLILRSRFTRNPTTCAVEPRRAPFVGQETLHDGSRLLALKAPGSRSRVRTIERTRPRP
ncbi:MAG: DUF692 domain-containing protein [Myxococcales bacterium]|nr:DUF692 domain-containing protein [Myxococcales bacterium]